jgi:IS30 family transposase
LRAVVEAKLGLCWSPEQIAGWLQMTYPDDATMRISHETIYLSLYVCLLPQGSNEYEICASGST